MARPSRRAIVAALLERHGRTYAEELRIDVAKGTPSPLFRLLCAAILFSARIGSEIAARAADGLRRAGWTTAQKLADSTSKQRVDVLNDAGYTRYQERTATMLGDMADHLLEEYRGDLRRLRSARRRPPRPGERRPRPGARRPGRRRHTPRRRARARRPRRRLRRDPPRRPLSAAPDG
jgi:hypothetical protein